MAKVSPWKQSFHGTGSPVLAPLSDLCATKQEDRVGTSDCRKKHRWLRHSTASLREYRKNSAFKIWFLGQQKVPVTWFSACACVFPWIQTKSRSSSVCPALSRVKERLLHVQGLDREIPYVLQKGWERGTSTHQLWQLRRAERALEQFSWETLETTALKCRTHSSRLFSLYPEVWASKAIFKESC